jgi:hypothetical protein
MSKRKVPDTCAKCTSGVKYAEVRNREDWWCAGVPCSFPYIRIPGRREDLPLPLKDCPLRRI